MPDVEIRVTMPDGSVWAVPARIIAENRAKYYSDGDEDVYKEEYDFTMGDNHQLLDWAAGDMNWDDVKDEARKIETANVEVDFQEGWVNGEKEVIRPK